MNVILMPVFIHELLCILPDMHNSVTVVLGSRPVHCAPEATESSDDELVAVSGCDHSELA